MPRFHDDHTRCERQILQTVLSPGAVSAELNRILAYCGRTVERRSVVAEVHPVAYYCHNVLNVTSSRRLQSLLPVLSHGTISRGAESYLGVSRADCRTSVGGRRGTPRHLYCHNALNVTSSRRLLSLLAVLSHRTISRGAESYLGVAADCRTTVGGRQSRRRRVALRQACTSPRFRRPRSRVSRRRVA